MTGTRRAWCGTCDAVARCDERGCIRCQLANQEHVRALRTNGPVAAGAFCSICIDGVTDLRAVQLDAYGSVYTVCKRCDDHATIPPTGAKPRWYVPIDETLERMRVRLLRALRHFDWTSTDELVAAMGIDEQKERAGYRRSLAYSVRRGFVECDRRDNDVWRYRITPAGRESYAAALRRNAA